MIKLKTKEEINILKEGGSKLSNTLKYLGKKISVGTSTKEIDEWAREMIEREGGEPAFLGYRPYGANRPFPASICVSINSEVIHGIPNENPKILKEGDVVSLDLGFKYKGLITDSAITIPVGSVDKKVIKLLEDTKKALNDGIKMAKIGRFVGDIGNAIEKIAEKNNYGIIEGLSGHGVGYKVHEDPYVPNWGKKGQGEKLEEGLVIAIEPMFSLGSGEVKLEKDGYTYSTKDGSLNAHFEHTIAITKNGPIILTD